MKMEQSSGCVQDALVSALYDHLMGDRPWDSALQQLMAHTNSAIASVRISLNGARKHECWWNAALTAPRPRSRRGLSSCRPSWRRGNRSLS